MEKVIIPKSEFLDLQIALLPLKQGSAVDKSMLASSTKYFSYYGLGLFPRVWQSRLWDLLKRGDRVAACNGRQVGKSIAGAIYVLQSALYNLRPAGVNKKTTWIIISATEEQSKEMIVKIKEIMNIGDEHVNKLTNGKSKYFFTSQISDSQSDRNDRSTITFRNGCKIISLPPTDRVRGYSPSGVWLDEFAFFENSEIYGKAVKPMVQDTKGQILITTTPNGQQGEFYNIFDPFDERMDHEYERLWLDYRCLSFDDPLRVDLMEREKEYAYSSGNQRQFDQEALALFTAQTGSFFDPDKVDRCVDKDLQKLESYSKPCDLGIDFGKVVSRTVVSIVELGSDNKTILLRYQYEYPPGDDLKLEDDIAELTRRFAIERVIYEDCPQAEHFRQIAIQKADWNVHAFVPQAEKNKKYNAFKQKVNTGKFKMYDEHDLTVQMKGMQYEETPRTTKIYAGSGLRDDRVDSVVIASKFMLEEQSGFKVYDWDEL